MDVFVSPHLLDSGVVRLDVQLRDVPDSFFGAGFHLVGSGGDWDLQDYAVGTVFGDVKPFVLVEEVRGAAHEIVAGISLKRGEKPQLQDGTVLSFFVVPKQDAQLSFAFEHAVASVFENGRRDIERVQWHGVEMAVQNAEALVGKNEMLKADILSAREGVFAGGVEVFGVNAPVPVFGMVALFLGLVALLSFFLILKRRRKNFG